MIWLYKLYIMLLLCHGEFHTDQVSYRSFGCCSCTNPRKIMAASLDKDTASDALPSYWLVLVDNMVIGDVLFSFVNKTSILSLYILPSNLWPVQKTRCGSGRGTACNTQVARPQVTVAAIQKKRGVGTCLETSKIWFILDADMSQGWFGRWCRWCRWWHEEN